MSIDTRRVLETISQSLLASGVIQPADRYAEASLFGLGMLMGQMAEMSDAAPDWLQRENAALRALFREATRAVADPTLASRLAQAGATRDESLRISALREGNAALRALLVELHAHVEGLDGEAARALDASIWDELRASVERRG